MLCWHKSFMFSSFSAASGILIIIINNRQQLVLTFLSSACKTCTQTLLLLLVYLTIQISANLIGQIIGRTSCCGNYPQSEALISHLYKTFFTLAAKKNESGFRVLWLFLPLWSQLGNNRRFTDCHSSHNRFSDHRLLLFFSPHFFFFSQGLLISTLCDLPSH